MTSTQAKKQGQRSVGPKDINKPTNTTDFITFLANSVGSKSRLSQTDPRDALRHAHSAVHKGRRECIPFTALRRRMNSIKLATTHIDQISSSVS